jgi:hypothetical protein
MNNHTSSLSIGDLLTRPKTIGIVAHVGIVVGPDTVLHNTPEKGEHLATVRDFANGYPVRVYSTGANGMTVQSRCRTTIAKRRKYHALLRNCEHTAYEVLCGIAKSPQVLAALTFGVIILLAFIVLRRR